MDDLLREFLTETNESLDTVDNQLVRFEQDPNNAKILDNIFRLVHTIKGTCGFLGLPRLEALAHAAETLMGKFRDGMPVTGEAVTLILSTIDRLKEILGQLEATEAEPPGVDDDLIGQLEFLSEGGGAAAEAFAAVPDVAEAPDVAPEMMDEMAAEASAEIVAEAAPVVEAAASSTEGTLVPQ
ncbi:Hpt domain-containing protein, partial [Rhodopseudomonas pseudopalustris]|uniref:Hpt domain-containing protein n=1 Tax=Rhodopseudomonas pseudopalustris TaxID=1513892 RepID=UPI003F9943C0